MYDFANAVHIVTNEISNSNKSLCFDDKPIPRLLDDDSNSNNYVYTPQIIILVLIKCNGRK